MAIIYASVADGYVLRVNQTSWVNARNNSSGTGYSSTTPGHASGISTYRSSSRGGGYAWNIYRSFFVFSTSGISSTLDSATLKIRGYNNSSGDVIALKATSSISALGTADFEEIVGWDSSSTDGSGGGDMLDSVTKYSELTSSWDTAGYNDITLNAQALADMKNDDYIYIAMINNNDLRDIDPAGSDAKNGVYYTDYTGTSRDPYIDYTVAATDNAVFFGTNF